MTIEKLGGVVKARGTTFYRIEREGDYAIYGEGNPAENYKWFDVFKVQKYDYKKYAKNLNVRFGMEINLDEVPDFKEKYPSDEDFGKTAWHYMNLDKAREKLNYLIEESKK